MYRVKVYSSISTSYCGFLENYTWSDYLRGEEFSSLEEAQAAGIQYFKDHPDFQDPDDQCEYSMFKGFEILSNSDENVIEKWHRPLGSDKIYREEDEK